MAEDDLEEEELEDVPIPEKGMKKKILLYLIPAIVLIGVGVGAVSVFFTSVGDEKSFEYDVVSHKNADNSGESVTVFYSLPELKANLRTSIGVFETISMKINLELSSVEDITLINSMMPRIQDIVTTHLVELTPEEVSGAEGFYALKTELLYRINLMVAPVKVLNLNIKSLDIQVTDTLERQED